MMGVLDENFRQDLAELMICFSNRDIDGLINQLIYMLYGKNNTRFISMDMERQVEV